MNTALIICLLFMGFTLGIKGQTKKPSLCTKPPSPNNGKINCVEDPAGFLRCYATCDSGFTFQSASVEFRTCNETDGSWPTGNSFPDCAASRTKCLSLSPPRNGIVKCQNVNDNLECTARCNEHFVFPTGQTTLKRVCTSNAGWLAGDSLPDCITDCNTQYVISSDNGIGSDDYITSSALSLKGHTFTPNTSDIFCVTEFCGWRPETSDLNQFVQINLHRPRRLLGIATKGLNNGGSDIYVTRFRILHSMDGTVFVPYSDENVTDKFFSGNKDGTSPRLQTFSCPFEAQYVRINPLEWNGSIGLRFELLGCETNLQKTTPTNHVTSITTQTTPIDVTPSHGTTVNPAQTCKTLLPPPNAAVNCQRNNEELSCTAICNDRYSFVTKQTVAELTCSLQTGVWKNGTNFPACILKEPSIYTTMRPPNLHCVSTQSDCNIYGNGDYNTCGDCRYFATCSEGVVYIRSCPNYLVFDAATGTCQFKSLTCRTTPPVPFG